MMTEKIQFNRTSTESPEVVPIANTQTTGRRFPVRSVMKVVWNHIAIHWTVEGNTIVIYKRHRCIIIQLAWKIDESSVTPDLSHDRARTFALSDIKAKVNQNTASEFPNEEISTNRWHIQEYYHTVLSSIYIVYTKVHTIEFKVT